MTQWHPYYIQRTCTGSIVNRIFLLSSKVGYVCLALVRHLFVTKERDRCMIKMNVHFSFSLLSNILFNNNISKKKMQKMNSFNSMMLS